MSAELDVPQDAIKAFFFAADIHPGIEVREYHEADVRAIAAPVVAAELRRLAGDDDGDMAFWMRRRANELDVERAR